MAVDVVTFGEAMIRLNPPGFKRLERASAFDVFVGGAELNAAVALTRLGRSAAWVSRLTNNALGKLIVNRVREAGVVGDHILWTDEDRVGLYFLEFGAAPRASSVLYDRKNSAIASIKPEMINWPAVLAGTKWFHVSGITPALSQGAAETTRDALEAARAAGIKTSIDLNYRAKLWRPVEAGRWMRECMPFCDVLISTEEDIERVLEIKGATHEEAARRLLAAFPLSVAALTIRENPLVWKNNWTAIACQGGKIYTTRNYEVEIVDRLGAGDAFAAGLIHGLLDGDLQKGLDFGVAASALKHTIPGDWAWIALEEVETVLKSGNLRINR